MQHAKYNPAFLSDEDLIRSFVVRQADLGMILERVRENTGPTNQHVLVLGPRGIGKTTLALRVVAEVRRDEELQKLWLPIVFGEESYQVCTPGEFWLEAVLQWAQKDPDERWLRTYRELRDERDESRLHDRALAQLLDLADSRKKRLLLVVENLDMLLGDQISKDDAWTLRHTLLHEPRIMLLATATGRFAEAHSDSEAMYELFQTHRLEPLSTAECAAIWQSVTGNKPSRNRIRPIQILTGGNPRLLQIICSFAAGLSLRQLMGDLMRLVDEHTEYFKSHLDNLAPTERKAYLALAELWDPSPARAVARAARLDVSKTSALLNRLVSRGFVTVLKGTGRTKTYQVGERMYNIYYLMRCRGAGAGRVAAAVRFMTSLYGEQELVDAMKGVAAEASRLEAGCRQDHFLFYQTVPSDVGEGEIRGRLLAETPREFITAPDAPDSFRQLLQSQRPKPSDIRSRVDELIGQAEEAVASDHDFSRAEKLYREAIEIDPSSAQVWGLLGQLLHDHLDRYEEAEVAYRESAELRPDVASIWAKLGQLLTEKLGRHGEAEEMYRRAIKAAPRWANAWGLLGQLLERNADRYEEAEAAYRKATQLEPDLPEAWGALGLLLHLKLRRYEEAEKAYRKALTLRPDFVGGWAYLGVLLGEELGRPEEAVEAFRKVTALEANVAWGWAKLGRTLFYGLGQPSEAEDALRKALNIEPEETEYRLMLAQLLSGDASRNDETEKVLREILADDPTSADAWAMLGEFLHVRCGRAVEAEEACQRGIRIAPALGPAWGVLGDILSAGLEKHGEAAQVYRRAAELLPGNVSVRVALGDLLREHLDAPAEAERMYRQALGLDPQHAGASRSLALLLAEQPGRSDEAEGAIRSALAVSPEDATSWVFLGRLLSERTDKAEEAVSALRRSVELRPDVWIGWSLLGEVLFDQGADLAQAEAAFRKAIECDPTKARPWAGLGRLLDATGRGKEAVEAYRESIRINPKPPEAWQGLIPLLAKRLKRPDDVVQLARECLAKSPDDPDLLNSLAWYLFRYGLPSHRPQAEQWAREAVGTEASNGAYQHTLASILCAGGKTDEAEEAARLCLRDPEAVEKWLDDAIDLFVLLAASGRGKQAARIIRESPSAHLLEPLVAGIQLDLGLQVRVATEILEVGKDVADRIRQRREERQAGLPPSAGQSSR